jgi:RNA polymerase sigma-70 factor (ECF subfamily)
MARRDAVRGPTLLTPRAGDEPEVAVGLRSAWSGELFATYQPRIRRYILSMVHDPDEADDLTQDVFLQAHRRLASLRDPDAVVSWLYRIATHICYDRFRKWSRQPRPQPLESDGSPQAGAAEPSLGRVLEQSEMSACVRGYLDELSDDYRNVVLLHDLEGLTSADIAEMLGVSVDAVKIRLHRARHKLEAALAAHCDFSRDEQGVFVCEPSAPSVHIALSPQRHSPRVYPSPAPRRPARQERHEIGAANTGGGDRHDAAEH